MSLTYLYKEVNCQGIDPDIYFASKSYLPRNLERSGDIGMGWGNILNFVYKYTNKYYGWKETKPGGFRIPFLIRPYKYRENRIELVSYSSNRCKSLPLYLGIPLKHTNIHDDGKDEFYYNQKMELHRDDGPARIRTNTPGSVSYEYFQNGKLHRTDGPADFTVSLGIVTSEKYFHHGMFHNPDGDAIIVRDSYGKVVLKRQIVNGTYIGPERPTRCKVHRNGLIKKVEHTWISKTYQEEFVSKYDTNGNISYTRYIRYNLHF